MGDSPRAVLLLAQTHLPEKVSQFDSMLYTQDRYDEAAQAYEEGLKTSPGDAALGRGLDDVLKAQAASKAPSGEST